MKLLVTGGHGFIGAHAVRLLSQHHFVLAPGRAELDLLDAGATEAYLREHKPDAVLHAATWNATRTSDMDLSRVLENNIRMHFNLVNAQKYFGRLIYYGSGAEFDRRHWQESMSESYFGQWVPMDDYGLSKYLIEKSREHDGRSCNLRLFGVYGPGEDWRIRFLSQACVRVVYDKPIIIQQNRMFDYTWVEDVIRATEELLICEQLPHTVNLSAGSPESLHELAKRIVRVAKKELPIYVENPELGQSYSSDNGYFHKLFPGFCFSSTEESIEKLYSHYASINGRFDIDDIR